MNYDNTEFWNVECIHTGGITINKGILTPGFDDDMMITVPFLSWLLRRDNHAILVDCGVDDNLIVNGTVWGGCPAFGGRKMLEESLLKRGVTLKEIDTVIFTHFHYDHVGNIPLFAKAKFVAQKDEWETINNQNFTQIKSLVYDESIIPLLRYRNNFILVDGDVEYLSGIKLIKVPGHTKGSQAIVVDSVYGRRVITGDIIPKRCNAFPHIKTTYDCDGTIKNITCAPEDWPNIPTSLLLDYYAYYESIEKFKLYMPSYSPEYLYCGHEAAHIFEDESKK